MYRTIVEARIRALFNELNKGNYEPILRTAANEFEHCFAGRHALSGRRASLPTTRRWYERLFTIFPNIRFQVHEVVVGGWPWNTTVAVEWSDSYTLLDGTERTNSGAHFIRLKWGRGVSVHIHCDTDLLLENLAIQHRGGIAEAAFEPLIDVPGEASDDDEQTRPANPANAAAHGTVRPC